MDCLENLLLPDWNVLTPTFVFMLRDTPKDSRSRIVYSIAVLHVGRVCAVPTSIAYKGRFSKQMKDSMYCSYAYIIYG